MLRNLGLRRAIVVPWVYSHQASRQSPPTSATCGRKPTPIARNGAVSLILHFHNPQTPTLPQFSNNRFSSTVLGKSTITTMPTPGGGVALVTISYWRSIDHLHAFAASPLHKAGWEWFGSIAKKWPHIGILHETFEAKQNGWENVYKNSWPVGMVSPLILSAILVTYARKFLLTSSSI